MGRSGTSLTSRVVGLLGIDLGSEASMIETIAEDNAKGYWEQQPIRLLNDELLAIFQCTWDRPKDLPPGWEDDPRVEPYYERARYLLAQLFDGGRRWGWKDPRTSLLLPFWRRVVGPMVYVLCFRNPLDVAHSLAARDPVHHPLDDSLALWMRYSTLALRHTQEERHLIVRYEDWFSDPRAQRDRLAAFVVGDGSPPPGWDSAARDFLDTGLRHHASSPTELLGDGALPSEVRACYALLPQDALDARTLPVFDGLWSGYRSRAALEAEVAAATERSDELRAQLDGAREETGAARDETSAARRETELVLEQLAEARREVEQLADELVAHQAWLDDIQTSQSWRLTSPLRSGARVARRMRV